MEGELDIGHSKLVLHQNTGTVFARVYLLMHLSPEATDGIYPTAPASNRAKIASDI
jgi:hypothetical protein